MTRARIGTVVGLRKFLTQRQVACLALREFDGLGYRSIGSAMGISHTMAWRHVRNARKKLRKAGVRVGMREEAGEGAREGFTAENAESAEKKREITEGLTRLREDAPPREPAENAESAEKEQDGERGGHGEPMVNPW